MLTRLRFKNFKAWKDTRDVRLAPLTVLFGTNSAGKTSIPQLLLLLKQTAASPDRQRVLHLGDSRTLVDLGSYADALHNHELTRPLDVELEWTLAEPLFVVDPLTGVKKRGDALGFEVSVAADPRGQPCVTRLRYSLEEDGGQAVSVGMTRRADGSFDLDAQGYPLVRQPGRDSSLPGPVRFYGFPDEATAYFQNTAFTADLVLELERLLAGVHYLGPLREYPKRLYLWSGEVPEDVGVKGDRAIEAILAGRDRSFGLASQERERSLPELVAHRLQAMGLIHDFSLEPLAPHRNEYEVLVRTAPDRPEVKLTDVGFGVSQVLPVLVECFFVPRRSIVIFEQPELHLHPKVQADLADLFVDAIRMRENGLPRDCQFIVESHSEHFLRRLQRRIAEEELSKDEAALYFVGSEQGAARLEELEVDDFGNILNWPDDFFGDEMGDLVARSEAQARRAARKGGQ